MKSLAAIAAVAALAGFPAAAQVVGPQNPTGPVCLNLGDVPKEPIGHTKVLDPQTILFYTRDGKVWKNTLKTRCPGLMSRGFVLRGAEGEVCSNATTISVIDSGETCTLGAFTPYTPPPAAP